MGSQMFRNILKTWGTIKQLQILLPGLCRGTKHTGRWGLLILSEYYSLNLLLWSTASESTIFILIGEVFVTRAKFLESSVLCTVINCAFIFPTKMILVASAGSWPVQTLWGCPRGVMVKAMDCGIVVSEFVLQLRYYVHFLANTLGKGMNPLILPAMG